MPTPTPIQQNFPPIDYGAPFVDESRVLTTAWRYFLMSVWNRTGGTSGELNIQASLDALSSTPGALIERGNSEWQGFAPGVQHQVLRMGGVHPAWGLLDGNNFGTVTANRIFAGPSAGVPAVPTFRTLVASDIPALPYQPASVAVAVTAAGANQATATVLTEMWSEVTVTPLNTGVRADNAVVGVEIVVFNRGANALNVYPAVGSQINALGVNAPFVLAIAGTVVLRPVSATQLYAL